MRVITVTKENQTRAEKIIKIKDKEMHMTVETEAVEFFEIIDLFDEMNLLPKEGEDVKEVSDVESGKIAIEIFKSVRDLLGDDYKKLKKFCRDNGETFKVSDMFSLIVGSQPEDIPKEQA